MMVAEGHGHADAEKKRKKVKDRRKKEKKLSSGDLEQVIKGPDAKAADHIGMVTSAIAGEPKERKQKKRKRLKDSEIRQGSGELTEPPVKNGTRKLSKASNRIEKQEDGGAVLAEQWPTVSIAVPGSIMDNTQTLERATAVSGIVNQPVVHRSLLFCS